MALPLSTADLARLEAATRALVSPLAMPDADAWRGEVMRAVCALFGAEAASFHLPGQARAHLVHGLDDTAARLLDTYMGPAWGKTGAGPDPMLDLFCHVASERALGAWDNAYARSVLGGDGDITRSPFWNDVVVAVHSEDSQSLFVPTPSGAVQLSAFALRRAPDPTDHLPVLRVLLPAFKAGLEALARLGAHRAALDALEEPLAAFDADGEEVHRNAALVRLLAADPEAALVEAALLGLVRRVRPLGFARRGESAAGAPVAAETRTTRARYALRAALLPPGAFGHGEAFLVSVVAPDGAPALPTVAEVRTRHGLTKREAEVALLVAQGRSNDEIAERLFVSKHTVRHHVEAAMAKLDLTGRGREAVAARLMQVA